MYYNPAQKYLIHRTFQHQIDIEISISNKQINIKYMLDQVSMIKSYGIPDKLCIYFKVLDHNVAK